MRRRIARVTRLVTLALVLGVVALAIPDSAVKSTEIDPGEGRRRPGRRDRTST